MGAEAARPRRLIVAALLLGLACAEKPRQSSPTRGNVERGRELYLSNCALCHGERGDGEGMRKMGLSSRPRNFSNPAWRARTSDRQIFDAIRRGVEGTSMPAFNSLDEEQVWDLVAYVHSFSEIMK